jgi:hypothetical protein
MLPVSYNNTGSMPNIEVAGKNVPSTSMPKNHLILEANTER